MKTLPTFFISHGAPDIILRDTPSAQFIHAFGPVELREAKAVLIISAHWVTESPRVMAHAHPSTIHDFGGFDDALYQMQYTAPGDPTLAREIATLIDPAHPDALLDTTQGRDHGAWMPLMMALPDAKIPVLQLSLQPHRDAAYHYALGQKLRPLRERGVAIIGSGSLTHNLRAFFTGNHASPAPQVARFAEWIFETLTRGDIDALLDWEKQAPDAKWNHPTPEHFLPFFVALGAAGAEAKSTRLHHSIDHDILAMDSYRFA